MPQRQERGKVTDVLKKGLFTPYYLVKGIVHHENPIETLQDIGQEAIEAAPIAIQEVGNVAESISGEIGSITGSFMKGLGITNIVIIIGGALLLLIILLKLI